MKDKAVLDASGASTLILNVSLLEKLHDQFDVFICPPLFPFEIGNIAWKYVKFDSWSEYQALEFISKANQISTIVELAGFESTMSNSLTFGLSFYDSAYLTLAQQTGAPLISKDKKLNQVAKDLNIQTLF